MDDRLQRYLDAPLNTAARASKPWLPEGKRAAKKAAKVEYEGDGLGEKITPKQARERGVDAKSAKLVSVLDYFATTTVPFDRIAEHVKMTVEDVEVAMLRRGRMS